MDTITGFYITDLELEGFKCYGEPVHFQFGATNLIRGGNGQGKSSIADAIAFAVTGTPFFGETGQDRLYNQGGEHLCITLDFIDDKGRSHRLKRKRIRTKGKDKMSIWFDDAPVRQIDLDFIFGERDVFLSIFNPLYFIERLGDQGRTLLARYLPDIPQEEVMARLDDISRTALEGEHVLSAEGYVLQLRGEKEANKQELIRLEGLREYLSQQESKWTQIRTALEGELNGVQVRIAELEEQRAAGIDFAALDEQYADACARYEELARKGPESTENLQTELERARQSLSDCRAKVYQSEYAQAYTETAAEVKALRGQYTSLRYELHAMSGNAVICPTCGTNMTVEEMETARQNLLEKAEKVLEAGRERAAQLQEIKELDAKALAVFEQFKAQDIAAGEEIVIQWQNKLTSAQAEAAAQHRRDLETVREQVQAADNTRSRGGLTEDEWTELSALLARRDNLSEKLEAQICPMEDPSGKASDISALQQENVQLEQKINAAQRYMEKRIELQFSAFQLDRVAISLYDYVKTTGELRSVFHFLYDGKPYRWLSLSEKLRAGMEVSLLVQRLTGRSYPLFVDNGESIPIIGDFRPAGQSFVAKVVAGMPLAVKTFGDFPGADTQPSTTAA